MSRITIDFEGLTDAVNRMNSAIESYSSLNSNLGSVVQGIGDSWGGQAANAYTEVMSQYMKQANQMVDVLDAFKQYAGSVESDFQNLDQQCAQMIRNAF
ncbi:hypothetical protein AUL39_05165 [Tractidigestivibacter scatoligenes]|jgi:WXG100 family type VII secretion target|uniref:ESAT-6-like protein n=1 Tax=Tractidigestivibacter scatoligenes TaxID=1299998 RepID=A0A100YVE2_TRASO|nr:WXG100 family type VII secretion target [Tractidigestivibacter scatoligenes]KUH58396.1 hypothetical protein AUL39_05165 [Tractidigestivibacter scatoligenes]